MTSGFFLNACTDSCSLHYNVRGYEIVPLNVHSFAFSESLSPSCAVNWAQKVALNLPVLCFKRHRSELCSVVAKKIKQEIKKWLTLFSCMHHSATVQQIFKPPQKNIAPTLAKADRYIFSSVCDEQSPCYK